MKTIILIIALILLTMMSANIAFSEKLVGNSDTVKTTVTVVDK